MTLNDLVSYNERHNEANLENNGDGHSNELSWNCGAEGPTEDPDIAELRKSANAQFSGDPVLVAGGSDAAGRR